MITSAVHPSDANTKAIRARHATGSLTYGDKACKDDTEPCVSRSGKRITFVIEPESASAATVAVSHPTGADA